jgi:hypothetical protein
MFYNIIKPICFKHFFTAQFLYATLLLPLLVGEDLIAQDLVLQDMSLSTAQTFSASNSITVGPNFTITNSGNATLISKTITMNPGCLILKGGKMKIISSNTAVGVQTKNSAIPDEFILDQNYPNPFNPSTIIQFSLPKQSFVTLRIYDVLGKEINVLLNDELQPGEYKVKFDAEYLSSGIYFYKLKSKEFNQVRKMMLVR